jgi:hypothetical protein
MVPTQEISDNKAITYKYASLSAGEYSAKFKASLSCKYRVEVEE